MSSDSSDDENLDLLREATDSQFINDSMFKENPSETVIKETQPSKKENLPSLRKAKDEDEQFNFFRVTPEFRNYVAKHLSKALEETLEKRSKSVKDSEEPPRKKNKKSGIRLFKDSKSLLKIKASTAVHKDNVQVYNRVKVYRNRADISGKIDKTLLKQVAVDTLDILSKKETKSWSNRSKATVFNYKKSDGGTLVLVEPEFK